MKKISSSYTKNRAIAFNVIENQNEMSFIYYYIEKINQLELCILLETLFVGNQPIRIQPFLKVNCLLFSKKNFNHFIILKMSIKNYLSFLGLLYKKKEKVPIDFLIDEIDVDS